MFNGIIYNHVSRNSVGLDFSSQGSVYDFAHEKESHPIVLTLLMREGLLSVSKVGVLLFFPDNILMCLAELECYFRLGGHVIPAHFDTENALWTFLSD